MNLTYAHLRRYLKVLKSMTGLTQGEFDQLLDERLPRHAAAEASCLTRPHRQRSLGAGISMPWR